MKIATLTPEFVEYIPETLSTGVLYVSMTYATAAHLCACGCGEEVVTPFSRRDWKLTFDGESCTLSPSIGNWDFACRSHYFVRRNRIQWASEMSDTSVAAIRRQSRDERLEVAPDGEGQGFTPFWRRILDWWFR